MPTQFWMHMCPGKSVHFTANPRPCSCGEPKAYDGWRNNRLEAMAWYQRFFGLKPIGPHHRLATSLLEGTTRLCEECSSRGYFDAVGGASFEPCRHCSGAGYSITVSAGRLAELRDDVLTEYPEAAAPSDLPHPAFSIVVHDVGRNLLVVVPRSLDA